MPLPPGAQAVLTEYNKAEGYVEAISFRIPFNEQTLSFRLPCDWKPVQAILAQQRERNRRIDPSRDQAVRTAWRIVKDWVEAQMALVETRMARTEEVFLPYAIMRDGKTLAETVQSKPEFLLGPGSGS